MKSILRTAVASVVSTLLINYDGAGSPLIQGVQSLRIKSAIQQQTSMHLNQDAHGPADVEFAQVNSQLKQKSASQVTSKVASKSEAQSKSTAEVDSKAQAQWGFLKNIVNIDRFFSSGVDDRKAGGLAQQQSSKQQSHTQQKSSQAQHHQSHASNSKSESSSKTANNQNKLSQVKSKATEDMEEDQLMKEAEESQADDAAAEGAAAQVAKTEDAQKDEQAQPEAPLNEEQNSKAQTGETTGQTSIADANEQTTQEQQQQQQEQQSQAPAQPQAPAAQTQVQAQPAQPAENTNQPAATQQQPQQQQQQTQQAPQAAAQTTAEQVIEQTQMELMKALNPTGKKQSAAEEEATKKMIQQLLEDVQKQAAGGSKDKGGKSDAEKAQDKENQKNDKEFQESEKTTFKSKEEKVKHDDEVRNEGLLKQNNKDDKNQEIDLEIEAPGAANKVAEEGAQTSPPAEFQKLSTQLAEARKKAENKLGTGGFAINFKDPGSFENSMKVLVFNDANKNENEIKVENFDTHDTAQTQTASLAMAMSLQGDNGATIVDDQPGKESIIQNMNSDNAKLLSQIASGYSIRHDLVQKMAPGDKQFHMVSWDAQKKFNNMKTFQKRPEAEKDYQALGNVPKILISGETGDVLLANGEQSMVDQCLGMFYTQRYQGKYFGQP